MLDLSARSLGAFRIALGLALLAMLWAMGGIAPTLPIDAQRHYAGIDLAFVHRLAAYPATGTYVYWIAVGSTAAFTAGIFTRASYAVLFGTLFLAVLIALEQSGGHDRSLLLVTMATWLAVPWGDGLSIDQLRRRRVAPDSRGAKYGFAIWIPGLTLGLALAAAAFAKLHREGLAWITTGAVRYHFVTDAASAPVDWGLWIAARPPLAVAMSAAAVVFEAAFILVILARRPVPRFIWGVAALGFFAGLYFFQGVLWYPWLVLLVAFLPWQWFDRRSVAAPAVGPATAMQRAWIVVLIVTQIYASARGIEREPFLSNFPMYSSTWPSTDAFDAERASRYTQVIAARADGTQVTDWLQAMPVSDQMALVRLAETGGPPPDMGSMCRAVAARLGAIPQQLEITIEQGGFDWNAGAFKQPERRTARPVPLQSVCLGAQRAGEEPVKN